jgi:hypothetical protein
MAFAPYVRLVVQGSTKTVQSWSCGMSFTNDGTATGPGMLTWLTTVDGLVKTWLAGTIATTLWDTTTVYNRLSAYSYPAAGHSATTASISSTGTTGTAPGLGTSQLAQVFSLRSGVSGRKGRGRFYMPATNREVPTIDGQIAGATLTALGNEFKTFVDAMNLLTIAGKPAILCIAGKASGVTDVATDVVLNSKIETQRRRQDKIVSDSTKVIIF